MHMDARGTCAPHRRRSQWRYSEVVRQPPARNKVSEQPEAQRRPTHGTGWSRPADLCKSNENACPGQKHSGLDSTSWPVHVVPTKITLKTADRRPLPAGPRPTPPAYARHSTPYFHPTPSPSPPTANFLQIIHGTSRPTHSKEHGQV